MIVFYLIYIFWVSKEKVHEGLTFLQSLTFKSTLESIYLCVIVIAAIVSTAPKIALLKYISGVQLDRDREGNRPFLLLRSCANVMKRAVSQETISQLVCS